MDACIDPTLYDSATRLSKPSHFTSFHVTSGLKGTCFSKLYL